MNARTMIVKAFRALLAKQSVSAISVGQIIADADVSKPTFYRYFYNKYEIIKPVLGDILEPLSRLGDTLDWSTALIETFSNVRENIDIIRTGFKSDEERYMRGCVMIDIIESAINGALERTGIDTGDKTIAFSVRSCSKTLMSAICGWACDSDRDPPEHVVKLLTASLPTSISDYITLQAEAPADNDNSKGE